MLVLARIRVIFETQGPIDLSCLSIHKCELSKTLGCTPAAHGSGTSVVQDRIGRIVLRVGFVAKRLCFVATDDCKSSSGCERFGFSFVMSAFSFATARGRITFVSIIGLLDFAHNAWS